MKMKEFDILTELSILVTSDDFVLKEANVPIFKESSKPYFITISPDKGCRYINCPYFKFGRGKGVDNNKSMTRIPIIPNNGDDYEYIIHQNQHFNLKSYDFDVLEKYLISHYTPKAFMEDNPSGTVWDFILHEANKIILYSNGGKLYDRTLPLDLEIPDYRVLLKNVKGYK